MATATNAKQVFENICTRFRADKAQTDKATFQFDLTGDDGGKFYTIIENGSCSAGEGPVPTGAPDMTIVAAADDFVKLVNGELNAMTAFMQGKVKVQGNMGMALKMQSWFDLS